MKLQSENHYDLIVPTCEEVFYFAKLKNQMKMDAIFCDHFEKLESLHNKMFFSQASQAWSIQTPETFLLTSAADWQQLKLKSENFVFKPVYSRFAAKTIIGPSEDQLAQTLDWSQGSWVAQLKKKGLEVCIYAVCFKGELKAFCAYRPTFRVGQGAGIYLEAFYDERLLNFCIEFAHKNEFHGQVAFDLILDQHDQNFWLLECNPRATSGVSFFDSRLTDCFFNLNKGILFADRRQPRMLAAAMVIYATPMSFLPSRWIQFYNDLVRGKDMTWDFKDPLPMFGQYISFAQFILISLGSKKSVLQISSEDFEYNG